MKKLKHVVKHQVEDYGYINIKLALLLDEQGITRNRLQKLTGIKYNVIDRYYKNHKVQLVDLGVLSKICYALGCKIEDILEYEAPAEEQE